MTTQGTARAFVECDGSVIVEVSLTTKEYILAVDVTVGDKSDTWNLPPSTGDGTGELSYVLTFRFATTGEAPTQFTFTDRDGLGNVGVHVESVMYRYEDSCQVETTVPAPTVPVTTVPVTTVPVPTTGASIVSIPLPIGVIGETTVEPPITFVEIPAEEVCMEDDPCFDCATMGNLQCGPVETVAMVDEPVTGATLPATGAASAVPVSSILAVGGVLFVAGLAARLTARRV